MDERSRKVLDTILIKAPSELTQADVEFIRARWAYVSRDDRRKFDPILKQRGNEVVPEPIKPEEVKEQDTSTHPADLLDDEDDDGVDEEVDQAAG